MTTDTPIVRGFEPEELRRAGRRVLTWRTDHNQTQRAFAKAAHVSVAAVQSLEAGTRQTRAASLDKIAKAIGLTRDQLVAPDDLDGSIAAILATTKLTWDFAVTIDQLLPDTLDVAWLYQSAEGELKLAIRDALRDYYTGQVQRRRGAPAPSSVGALRERVTRAIPPRSKGGGGGDPHPAVTPATRGPAREGGAA